MKQKLNLFSWIALLVVVSAFIVTAAARAESEPSQRYSMSDLRALATSESWVEMFSHMTDIAPAKRNAEWNKLLVKSGIGLLDTIGAVDDPYRAFLEAEEARTKFRALGKSRDFMEKRNKAGLVALERCYQDRYRDCYDTLDKLVKTDSDDHQLAFDAGLLASHHVPRAASKFFRAALEKVSSDQSKMSTYCSHKAVAKAVVASFGGPVRDAEDAQAIAFQLCKTQLQQPLMAAFLEADSTYVARNLCPELIDSGQLSPFQTAFCHDVMED